jgi:hypothetical protein
MILFFIIFFLIMYIDIDYCGLKQYNDNIVFLPKKLVKHVVESKIIFLWDTFEIEKIIENEMVCSGFLNYNIDTDLFFRI